MLCTCGTMIADQSAIAIRPADFSARKLSRKVAVTKTRSRSVDIGRKAIAVIGPTRAAAAGWRAQTGTRASATM